MGYAICLLDIAVVFGFQEWLSLLLRLLQEHQMNLMCEASVNG
jgi:hypothetical protein